ncbi:MAG: hypothetical protein M1597_00330 [Candidatus Thermoplasmatota archaeon]|nr:hypothetical protein [Candidatus Thermoplasmatota archaeon]
MIFDGEAAKNSFFYIARKKEGFVGDFLLGLEGDVPARELRDRIMQIQDIFSIISYLLLMKVTPDEGYTIQNFDEQYNKFAKEVKDIGGRLSLDLDKDTLKKTIEMIRNGENPFLDPKLLICTGPQLLRLDMGLKTV